VKLSVGVTTEILYTALDRMSVHTSSQVDLENLGIFFQRRKGDVQKPFPKKFPIILAMKDIWGIHYRI